MKSIRYIAYIISWNLWQMDGIKGVIPNTCGERHIVESTLFGDNERVEVCQGCLNGDITKHNGIYARVKDWGCKSKDENKLKPRFIDLLK